ncbi:MAG: MFS transporter [Pseudomonadota bacterium]
MTAQDAPASDAGPPTSGDPAEPTWRFVRRAAATLAVGAMLAFSSSFGQTFFLSLFGGVWREAFNLSHGAFGAVYAAATLASAASLLWLGKIVDQAPPSQIATTLLVLTALASVWLSSAASAFALGIGLFAMRVLGQGLLSHLAMTMMAKWFDAARGRALGVAMLGFPIGEAVLPILATSVAAAYGWRTAWIGVAGLVVILLAPAIFLLARQAEAVIPMSDLHQQNGGSGDENSRARPSWRRHDALRDWRFYALAPGLLATPFIITSVLFHQAHLVDVKRWTLTAFSALFPLYAIASITAGLVCGRIVDAVGTRRVLPYFLLPLSFGLLFLSLTDNFVVAALFMAMMGATAGAATIVYTSIWSELYGTGHLGAIRAAAVSAMVLSSAVGPALIGVALDAGVGLDAQLRAMCAAAAAAAVSLALLEDSLRWRPPPLHSLTDDIL